MTRRLTATMAEALGEMRDQGGELVRWRGGYWTLPGCPVGRAGARGGRRPSWYAGSATVRGLISRGEVAVTERDARGEAVRVALVR